MSKYASLDGQPLASLNARIMKVGIPKAATINDYSLQDQAQREKVASSLLFPPAAQKRCEIHNARNILSSGEYYE